MVQQIHVDVLPAQNFTLTKSDLAVRFTPYQIPENAQLTWNFGDGYVNNVSDTVWHNYDEIGTYTVCLEAMNQCGATQVCKTVIIQADVSYNFFRRYKENSPFYNGDQYGNCIAQTSDGGYLLGGSDDTQSSPGWDGIIARFDTAGHHVWTRIIHLGSGWKQHIDQLTATRDGGALFSGSTHNTNKIHAFGRIDSTGFAWYNSMSVGSSFDKPGNSIELKDGRTIYSGTNNLNGYIIVFNKNGSLLFYREYSAFDNIFSIRRSADNNFYVFGNAVGTDLALMKLDSSFNILWSKKIDFGNDAAYSRDMQISATGKIYMTGQVINTNNTYHLFIICADLSGNTIWTKKILAPVTSGALFGRSLAVDKKSNLYISSISNENALTDRVILKTDSLGNILSSKLLNTANFRLTKTHDDGVAIAATSHTYFQGSTYSFDIIKADKDSLPPCSINNSLTLNSTVVNVTVTSLTNIANNLNPLLAINYCFNNIYSTKDSLQCLSSSVLTPSFVCTNPCVGGIVNFNNLSLGPVISQQWTFSGATPSTSTLQNPSVNWVSTGVYTVNLTVNGIQSYSQTVTIFPPASIAISPVSATVCSGNTITLNATGAVSYTWNGSQTGASIVISPTTSSSYTAVSTNSNGCIATATNSIIVNQLPLINTLANPQLICSGQSATLIANGGLTYTWNPGGPGQSVVVSPTTTSIYTVTSTGTNNCLNSALLTVSVSVCTDLNNLQKEIENIIIYPNPFDNIITVLSSGKQNVEILNSLGMIIYSGIIENKINTINMKDYARGVYYIRVGSETKKMIKQ